MYLDELLTGERVFLEMRKGSSVYEVVTKVVGTAHVDERQALLQPFSYKGKVMDLGNHGVSDVVFSIYTVDGNHERIGWSNVKIRMVEYKGQKYYAATSQKFHERSDVAERRENERIQVHIPATMLARAEQRTYPVEITDVSDSGIAFITKKDLVMVNRHCQLTFSDEINGSDYDIEVDCTCVRKESTNDGMYIYGCEVMDASQQMLAYVYIKKIMDHYKERNKQES
ncbi:MAG: PilZ domain-containing protein [Eubacterium sp.]|nr:PilZ domain-containing protein [Eubacterium sp.]